MLLSYVVVALFASTTPTLTAADHPHRFIVGGDLFERSLGRRQGNPCPPQSTVCLTGGYCCPTGWTCVGNATCMGACQRIDCGTSCCPIPGYVCSNPSTNPPMCSPPDASGLPSPTPPPTPATPVAPTPIVVTVTSVPTRSSGHASCSPLPLGVFSVALISFMGHFFCT